MQRLQLPSQRSIGFKSIFLSDVEHIGKEVVKGSKQGHAELAHRLDRCKAAFEAADKLRGETRQAIDTSRQEKSPRTASQSPNSKHKRY